MPLDGGVGSGCKELNLGAIAADSNALRQQGNEAFKRRDYGTANELYGCALDDAAAGAAARAAILSNRALALFKLGQYAASAADAEASLALDGSSQKARYRAAVAHLMLGRPQSAQPLVAGLMQQEAASLNAAAEPHLSALPPHLHILQAAAESMASHAGCKAHLEATALRGVRGAGPSHADCPAACQGAARVQELLQALQDDMDGVEDADISSILRELPALLLSSGNARAAFEAGGGYPLALCYLTEAYSTLAAPVLQAASGWQPPLRHAHQQQGELPGGGWAGKQDGGAVLWPPLVWQRLASTALAAGGGAPAAAAMRLMAWAAGDPWARTQLLVHPLPSTVSVGGAGNAGTYDSSLLRSVLQALKGLPQSGLSPPVIEAALELLSRYGEDAPSAEALLSLQLRPMQALLHVYAAVPPLLEPSQALIQPQNPSGGMGPLESHAEPAVPPAPAGEEEALEQLRQRQRDVFNAGVVRLHRCTLSALVALCRSPELAIAEAPAGSRSKKGPSQPQGFLPGLVKLARSLHEQSPKRTCAVLGPDGRPRTYSKKPFAADFKDNPAGDFLASLDLDDAAPGKTLSLDHPTTKATTAAAPEPAPQLTLLELSLTALLQLASGGSASPSAQAGSGVRGGTALAGHLYRLDVLGLCEALWGYTTPGVVELSQRLCATVAERHPPALNELLQDGSVIGLASVLQYTPLPEQYPSSINTGTIRQEDPASGAKMGPSTATVTGRVGSAAINANSSSTAGAVGHAEQGATVDGTAAVSQAVLQLVCRAADKLTMLVDGCSGDEFFHLTQHPGGALLRAFQLSRMAGTAQARNSGEGCDEGPPAAASKLRGAAQRFVLMCCDRAQRQQGIPRWQRPRGGAWDRCSAVELQAMLPAKGAGSTVRSSGAAGTAGGGSAGQGIDGGKEAVQVDSGEGLTKLKRGFFGARGSTKRTPAGSSKRSSQVRQMAPAVISGEQVDLQQHSMAAGSFNALSLEHSRMIIEDITEQEGTAAPVQQAAHAQQEQEQEAAWSAQHAQHAAWKAQQTQQQEEQGRESGESDDEELRDVYDSTPSQQVRQIRNAWMNVPLAERVRWDQTSSDVNAWVVMPRGTRARDVKVSIQPGRLTVSLGWYGQVVDGELHRRCKASEAQWCMEDNEVHVILPKDDRSYWKALFVDGEERSYFDLLKEAVNADEPATPYDEMDERSKELLDQMLERQAMIREGLIDLEGFDDFRVVLGESSLAQS